MCNNPVPAEVDAGPKMDRSSLVFKVPETKVAEPNQNQAVNLAEENQDHGS